MEWDVPNFGRNTFKLCGLGKKRIFNGQGSHKEMKRCQKFGQVQKLCFNTSLPSQILWQTTRCPFWDFCCANQHDFFYCRCDKFNRQSDIDKIQSDKEKNLYLPTLWETRTGSTFSKILQKQSCWWDFWVLLGLFEDQNKRQDVQKLVQIPKNQTPWQPSNSWKWGGGVPRGGVPSEKSAKLTKWPKKSNILVKFGGKRHHFPECPKTAKKETKFSQVVNIGRQKCWKGPYHQEKGPFTTKQVQKASLQRFFRQFLHQQQHPVDVTTNVLSTQRTPGGGGLPILGASQPTTKKWSKRRGSRDTLLRDKKKGHQPRDQQKGGVFHFWRSPGQSKKSPFLHHTNGLSLRPPILATKAKIWEGTWSPRLAGLSSFSGRWAGKGHKGVQNHRGRASRPPTSGHPCRLEPEQWEVGVLKRCTPGIGGAVPLSPPEGHFFRPAKGIPSPTGRFLQTKTSAKNHPEGKLQSDLTKGLPTCFFFPKQLPFLWH